MSETKGHELDEKIQQYRTTLEKDPGSPQFVPLAETYLSLGNPEDALEVCRGGLAFLPDLATGRLVLAKALCRLGRLREAEAELAALVALAPEMEEAKTLLHQLRSGQLITVDVPKLSPLSQTAALEQITSEENPRSKSAQTPLVPHSELLLGKTDDDNRPIKDEKSRFSQTEPNPFEQNPFTEKNHVSTRNDELEAATSLNNRVVPKEKRKESGSAISEEWEPATLLNNRVVPKEKREQPKIEFHVLPEEIQENSPSISSGHPSVDMPLDMFDPEQEEDEETRPLIDLTPPTEAGLSWEGRAEILQEAQGGLAELFGSSISKKPKIAFEGRKNYDNKGEINVENEEIVGDDSPELALYAPKRRRTQLLARKGPNSPLAPLSSQLESSTSSAKESPHSPAPVEPIPAPVLPHETPSSQVLAKEPSYRIQPPVQSPKDFHVIPEEDDDEKLTEVAVRNPRPNAFSPQRRDQKNSLQSFSHSSSIKEKLQTNLSRLTEQNKKAWLFGGVTVLFLLALLVLLILWMRSSRHNQEALALLSSGDVLLAEGSYAGLLSASQVLEDAIVLRPDGPNYSRMVLLEGLRVEVFGEDRIFALRDVLDRAKALSFEDDLILFGKGVLLAHTDLDRALSEVREWRVRYAKSGFLAFLEAEILAEKAYWQDAESRWKEALGLSPGLSWARLGLGEWYILSPQNRLGLLDLLSQELTARPNHPRAMALALLASEQNLNTTLPPAEELAERLQKSLSSALLGEREIEWARVAIARRAYLQNNQNLIEQMVEALLRQEGPKTPGVGLLLGELLLARGQSTQAEKILRPLVEVLPGEKVFFLLAQALLHLERSVDAQMFLSKLPQTPKTRALQSYALFLAGNKKESKRKLRALQKEDPNEKTASLYLANIWLKEGDVEKARAQLGSWAITMETPLLPPPYPLAFPLLIEAQVLSLEGSIQKAQQILLRAKTIAPKDEALARIRAKLGLLPQETLSPE